MFANCWAQASREGQNKGVRWSLTEGAESLFREVEDGTGVRVGVQHSQGRTRL